MTRNYLETPGVIMYHGCVNPHTVKCDREGHISLFATEGSQWFTPAYASRNGSDNAIKAIVIDLRS